MGKRKQPHSQTLIHQNPNPNPNSNSNSNSDEGDDQFRSDDLHEEDEETEKPGFFACYLLTSLCPRYKGHTYIGFTVNPRRRIRQHNGELCSGAFRTKKKRPWEMVLCIHGFPTNTAALQFEWAWQHPVESLAVRKAAVGFKSLGGLANKIKLAYTMLTLPAWNKLNLTVNFFSTKYTKHYAGCPTLPAHMRVHVRSMDELPCYTEGFSKDGEDDIFRFENDLWDNEQEPEETGPRDFETAVEDVTVPVHVSANHQNNEEKEVENNENDTFRFEKYLWDCEQEPEKTGPHDFQTTFEDETFPVHVSASHRNDEEKEKEVEDDTFRFDNDLWDYEQPEKTGPHDFETTTFEDVTIPLRVSASHRNNEEKEKEVENDTFRFDNDLWDYEQPKKTEPRHLETTFEEEAICVSDDENYEQPSCKTSGSCDLEATDHQNNEEKQAICVSDDESYNDSSKNEVLVSVSAGEIEVIDVFSPSPEYRDGSRKKKRGGSFVGCPEIIDLTQSPICV